MPTLGDSFKVWARGLLRRSYFWLGAGVIFPLDLYNDFKPADWPAYSVTLESFLFTLGGLVLWTSFLTYHDLRRDTPQGDPQPDMPLHKAARWLVEDAEWGASLSEDQAAEWKDHVAAEMVNKLSIGRLDSWGYYQQDGHLPMKGPQGVPTNYYTAGHINWHLLDENTPVQAVSHAKSLYRRIELSEAQVHRIWPRRSRLSRLLRNKPIDRVIRSSGVIARWKSQDAIHKAYLNDPPYSDRQSQLGLTAKTQDELEADR